MLMRWGRGKKILAAVVALLLCLTVVLFFANRSPYAFLRRLGGEPRESGWPWAASALRPVRCFSFTGSYDHVLKAMKGDLAEQGWEVRYEDPSLAIFRRSRKGVNEQATLIGRTDRWSGPFNERPDTHSILWIPYEETWLEQKVGALERMVGLRPKRPRLCTLFPDVRDLAHETRTNFVNRNPVVDVIWHNVSGTEKAVRLDILDLNNYESVEALPASFKVPARSGLVQQYLFPEAAAKAPHTGISIRYTFPGGTLINYADQPEPSVDAEPKPGGEELQVWNTDSARAYEIRNLRLLVNDALVGKLPGVVRIEHGSQLGIPLKAEPDDSRRLTFEYRLLPNKRWRKFDLDGD